MFRYSKLDENAIEPVKAHLYDAGFDLAACEVGIVPARGQLMINTAAEVKAPATLKSRPAKPVPLWNITSKPPVTGISASGVKPLK